MQPITGELSSAMNNINSMLNQQQVSRFHEINSHNDFLEQILSSVPSSAASTFTWTDDLPPPVLFGDLEDQSTAVLASKLRQHQISNGPFILQQPQLLHSKPANGLIHNQNDVVDSSPFKSANLANEYDASIKTMFNGFIGSLTQTSNQPRQYNHSQGVSLINQPALSGSSGGGGAAGQPRQRVRARRGQATDPHSIAERLRRERIAERMQALQELVPNGNKTDKASMLDEIIDYVKFLQLQVKVLSMSRLGGAAAIAPLVADMSSEGNNSSSNNDGITATEQRVAKLMEDDMGSAMPYLQGKGLCLMPISLDTAISTSTSYITNPLNSNGTTVY